MLEEIIKIFFLITPLPDVKTCKGALVLILEDKVYKIRIYQVLNVHNSIFLLILVLELLCVARVYVSGIFQSIVFTILFWNIVLNIMP